MAPLYIPDILWPLPTNIFRKGYWIVHTERGGAEKGSNQGGVSMKFMTREFEQGLMGSVGVYELALKRIFGSKVDACNVQWVMVMSGGCILEEWITSNIFGFVREIKLFSLIDLFLESFCWLLQWTNLPCSRDVLPNKVRHYRHGFPGHLDPQWPRIAAAR